MLYDYICDAKQYRTYLVTLIGDQEAIIIVNSEVTYISYSRLFSKG